MASIRPVEQLIDSEDPGLAVIESWLDGAKNHAEWLRVLGGGHPRLPRAIHDFNGISAGHSAKRLPGAVIVADDAVGGFFALNGGGIPGAPGHVFYFPPTSLEWEDVAPSYSDWLV